MNKTKTKRVVIKLGTSTLTAGGKALDRAQMLEIVRVIARLRENGCQVAVVSSGAQAAGREVLSYPSLPAEMSSKQLLASVGQGKLIEVWESLFSIYKMHIGQILLTRADLEDRERYLNARDTMFALLQNDVVPVINENDAVSTAEIKVGDNDNLAALTAVLCDADLVILLTDQKGLYTADPRTDVNARLIHTVDKIDEQIIALAGGSGTSLGTGGMATKIRAAQVCVAAGIELVIASGSNPQQIPSLVAGTGEGTFFKPVSRPVESRKMWIGSATRAQGTVIVDDGAKEALTERGSSLLPKGIKTVEQDFLRGATVVIRSLEGKDLARGLVRYSSDELRLIAGKHSDDIEKILGFTHGSVAIHRDDMVIG
ncbi:MAG: glutamate 5-kinase [Succinivibrio sp.]|nr:glutamate 5-kinase [Succinivibrio sp.]